MRFTQGCVINLLSYHNNIVYSTTLSESQRLMLWQLILKEFGTNIQHIAGVDNIVADTLSILRSMSIDKYKSCTRKDQCRANGLFSPVRVEKMMVFFTKSINCTKRTTKITEEYIFQT